MPGNFAEEIRKYAESIRKTYKATCRTELRYLSDFRTEVSTLSEYRRREIIEMLQNANDAHSSFASLKLDTANKKIIIANGGDGTKPFSAIGMRSIFLAHLSPKKYEADAEVGCKGLGFRSLLNWATDIRIRCHGLTVSFNEANTEKFARELEIDPNANAEARQAGRKVPLAILALPEIKESTVGPVIPDSVTEIELRLSDAAVENVRHSLEEFTPESLLFLKYLREVVIDIDGRVTRHKVEDRTDGTKQLNNEKWLIAKSGAVDEQAAVAYNLTNRRGVYRLHCFFHTDIELAAPCVIHGSFELNSSRTRLIKDNEKNRRVAELIPPLVKEIADRLKDAEPVGWAPFRLLASLGACGGEYIQDIAGEVTGMLNGGEYLPTFGGTYKGADATYFVSETFAQFVEKEGLGVHFPDLILPGYNGESQKKRIPVDAINAFFEAGSEKWIQHAEIVKHLLDAEAKNVKGLEILPAADGSMIGTDEVALVNVGVTIKNIPAFLRRRYLSPEFQNELKALLGPEREVTKRLQTLVGDKRVADSDFSGMKQRLTPTASTPLQEAREMLRCLFNAYNSLQDVEREIPPTNVWLPAADGSLREAATMVFGHKEWGCGVENVIGNNPYRTEMTMAPPEALDYISEDTDLLREFFCWLGVRRYVVTKKVVADKKYYPEAIPATQELYDKMVGSAKISGGVEALDAEVFDGLSLADALSLIMHSNLVDKICGSQEIDWFNNKWRKFTSPLSYVTWQLRNARCFAQLPLFAVDEEVWFNDSQSLRLDDVKLPPAKSVLDLKSVLVRLGAMTSVAEAKPEVIYSYLKSLERRFDAKDRNPEGFQSIYSRMKDALNSRKGEKAEPPSDLKVLCRKGTEYAFVKASEAYYWDNDRLPRQILDRLWAFAIGRREGEETVQSLFGVKRLDDLNLRVDNVEENTELQSAFTEDFAEAKPYLLAAVIVRQKDITPTASALKNIKIRLVKSAVYSYSAETDRLGKGEMIYDSATDTYYICSGESSLDRALADFNFCDVVALAICMKLKLSSAATKAQLRALVQLRGNREDIVSNDLNPADLTRAREALGSTEEYERRERIKSGRNALLADLDRYRACWQRFVHKQCEGEQKLFVRKKDRFDSVQALITDDDIENGKSIVEILQRFCKDVDWRPDEEEIRICKEYEGLYPPHDDDAIRSLFYYPGHREELEAAQAERLTPEPQSVENDEPTGKQEEITLGTYGVYTVPEYEEREPDGGNGGGGGGGKPHRKPARREAERIGRLAEQTVLKMLEREGLEVTENDSLLTSESASATGRKGYDFKYRNKEGQERMLEVKSFATGEFIMSKNEWAVGKVNSDIYDIALVVGGNVEMMLTPFRDFDMEDFVTHVDITVRPVRKTKKGPAEEAGPEVR